MTAHQNEPELEQPSMSGSLTATRRPGAPSGRSADPVRGLLERHQRLCQRAVDPLEIAVGLEADGLTDRGAARFRHRDVFSLAEELYARTPLSVDDPAADRVVTDDGQRPYAVESGPAHGGNVSPTLNTPRTAGGWALPGLLCTLMALLLTWWDPSGVARWVVGAAGALAVAAALIRCLRGVTFSPPAIVFAALLLGYALYGDGLLRAALAGGPEEIPARAEWCVPLTLAWAVAAGLGCARWFALRAGARLPDSPSLAAFAAAVRPLLALTVLAFVLLVLASWVATHYLLERTGGAVDEARWPSVVSLALLLFLALLLSAHGFPHAASTVLAGAVGLELLALALVFAGRLPSLGWLDAPVELLVVTYGETSVVAVSCLAVSAVALRRADRLLSGASAHRGAWGARPRRGS